MALRQFHLLHAYASVGPVKLAFFYRDKGELGASNALRRYCDSLHPIAFDTVYRPPSKDVALWRRRLEQTWTLAPTLAYSFESREMRDLVEQLASDSDLVHVAKLWMVPNVITALRENRGRLSTVLDLDDLETVVKQRSLALFPPKRWQRRLFEWYDMQRLRRYQARSLKLFDRVLVCSNTDQRRLGGRNVSVIPNGTMIPARVLPEQADEPTLLCTGTLRYGPNVDGVLFFVREILPLVREDVPGVRLLIVGRAPAEQIRALHDGNRVLVVGDVPSLEPYYRQATATVVSLRVGGGTRLRILEAFAFGRPVVSTSVGCEGLEVTNRQHLLVGDEPGKFAKACVELLKDPELRRRLVAHGRRLVEDKYDWRSIEDRLKTVADEVLDERRRRRFA
jgi:glycosyltransferase involved in cell wall biosynthesis